jgi:hypothetical protein
MSIVGRNVFIILPAISRKICRADLKELARQGLSFYGGMGSLNDIVLSANEILLIEKQ